MRKDSDLPHITALLAHNVIGVKLPPFIILPNSLQNLPAELAEFSSNERVWFASSSSGWMNADLFHVWSILFINWLSTYRCKLHPSIRNHRALLVMDGHASRECPRALEMLRRAGVDVLILPAHTTHITQMFDICLAAPLKKAFAANMQKLLKDCPELPNETMIGKLRYCSIEALLSSWESVCTSMSCSKAAKKAGWYPFSEEAAASSKYAIERTEEEDEAYLNRRQQRTRLDINARIINTPEFISILCNKLRDNPLLGHLALLPDPQVSWETICRSVCTRKLNNKSFFLSGIPACVMGNGFLLTFD